MRLGATNQLRFDFDYTTLLASGAGRCETYSFTQNHAVIDGASTIDFSGYRHFMAMPDLRVSPTPASRSVAWRICRKRWCW